MEPPEWWGELASILERGSGPVMHALAFLELNGLNLRYPQAVQDGLLSLVLAQLRRLPAALVCDFVLAYADSRPSPMTKDWTRRLVCRICQQLRAIDARLAFPVRLREILRAADDVEEDERYKVGLAAGDEDEDGEEDNSEGESEKIEVIEVLPEDEVVQEAEWDHVSSERQEDTGSRKEEGPLKRKRKKDRAVASKKRRPEAEDSEDEEREDEDEDEEGGEVSVELFDIQPSDDEFGASDDDKAEENEEDEEDEGREEADHGSESAGQPAGGGITAEAAEQIDALRRELQKIGQEGKTDVSNHDALELLRHHPQLESMCQLLQPHELLDEALAFLCGQLFSAADISYKRCNTLIQYLLLPKIQGLERSVSRVLSTAISSVAKQHPSPLTDALLLPLITAPAMGVPQGDVVNRVLKECFDPGSALQFFKTFLSSTDSGEDESFSLSQSQSQSQDAGGSGVIWTENTIAVLHTVVDMKGMVLPTETFDLFLVQLDRHAAYFAASLKFSALLLSLITKHGKQVAHSKDYVGQIVSKSTTFMKKAALAKLAKL